MFKKLREIRESLCGWRALRRFKKKFKQLSRSEQEALLHKLEALPK